MPNHDEHDPRNGHPVLDVAAEKPPEIADTSPPKADPAEQRPAQALPANNIAQARAALDAQIRSVVEVMISGILSSAPTIPVHEVLFAVSRVTGEACAKTLAADLPTTFKLRQGFRDAFEEGTKRAPIVTPPAAQQQPQTRPHMQS